VLRVHDLLEIDAQLLPYRLELLEVLVVLALALDFCLDALEDAHGGGEVVDAAGGAQGGGDDRGGGHEVVGEGVVEVSLWGERMWLGTVVSSEGLWVVDMYLELEDIVHLFEFLLVSASQVID